MKSARGLLLLALPVIAAALLGLALLVRGGGPAPARSATRAVSKPDVPRQPVLPATAPVRQQPASDDVVARSTEDAYVRSTYQNLKIAVASGNAVVQKALLDVLGPNRTAALRLAEQDLASPRSQNDRDLSLLTLELLRNPP